MPFWGAYEINFGIILECFWIIWMQFSYLWGLQEGLLEIIWRSFGGHFGTSGPPGEPLGSKYLPGASLDSPRTLQETLLEPHGADLGLNLNQRGANLGPT